MVVKCEQVWREISNYLDDDVSPDLRVAIEQHVAGCKECAAVLEGTRNVVHLYGDERMLEVPLGFSHRLQRRLEDNMNTRRNFMGWLVAAAAAAIVLGSFEIVRSSSRQRVQRSEHAQSGSGVPPEMLVLVSTDSKLFHVSGCPFIHDKEHVRTVVAREAEQEGYTPCVRCMKKYLSEDRPDEPFAGESGARS
jgi:hypothetical protein